MWEKQLQEYSAAYFSRLELLHKQASGTMVTILAPDQADAPVVNLSSLENQMGGQMCLTRSNDIGTAGLWYYLPKYFNL